MEYNKLRIFYLFSLILYIPAFTCQKLIYENPKYIDFIEIDDYLLGLNVTFGYPPEVFELLFDTASLYTWVRGDNCVFCSYVANTYKKKSLYFQSTGKNMTSNLIRQIVNGEGGYDYINLNIYSATNMGFLIVNEDNFLEGLDGVLGLGYSSDPEDLHFSILEKLYLNNQIQGRIFSIKYDDVSSKLLFGKVPSEIEADPKNYSICHVNKTLNSWNCKISHLLPVIGADTDYNFYNAIPLGVDVIFATSVKNMLVPVNYLQFFLQNYFKNYPNYDQKFCRVKSDLKNNFILCDSKYFDLNKAPYLYLIINGHLYKIAPIDLFDEIFSDTYNQFYSFKITFVEGLANQQWIFGYTFLKQYQTVFNKEKNQIGFYGGFRYDFTKFTADSTEEVCFYNYGVYIFFISLIVLSMGYVIYKKKRKQLDILRDIAKESTFIKKISSPKKKNKLLKGEKENNKEYQDKI